MAAPSGLDAQLSIVDEVTYGTAVTTTRFFEPVSESIKQTIDRIEAKAIRTGTRVQRSDRYREGSKTVDGSLELEVLNKSFGIWLKHMFGGVATSGPVSTLYTHTFTPGVLTGKSFTLQKGVPDLTGTVQPFTYEGCKVKSWELGAKVGDALSLKLDLVGEEEKSPVSTPSGPALAAASFPSTAAMLVFVDGSLTVAGTAFPVHEFSLKGDNGLDISRRFIGSQIIKEPLEAGIRQYTADLKGDFNDTVTYARFVAMTEAALVLTFAVTIAAVTFSLTITCNVRFDGETPTVGDTGIVPTSWPVKCTDSGAGAQTAITAVYVTTDTLP